MARAGSARHWLSVFCQDNGHIKSDITEVLVKTSKYIRKSFAENTIMSSQSLSQYRRAGSVYNRGVPSCFSGRHVRSWEIRHTEEAWLRTVLYSLASPRLQVRQVHTFAVHQSYRQARHKKYVTLKLLRADCYGGPHDIFEREILSKISDMSRNTTYDGARHILPLLGDFTHTGPNGDHVCLVFDVLGHHLDFQCAKYEDGRLPVRAVKLIARQLLLGPDFLHRECGVIHTGMGIVSNTFVLYFLQGGYSR